MTPPTSSGGPRKMGATGTGSRSVLLVGEARGFLTWAPVLDREVVRVRAVRHAVEAHARLGTGDYRAVVAIDPLPDLPIGAFVEQIVQHRPPELRGILVVTADEDDPPTLPMGGGLRVHCCTVGDSHGVEESLVELLELESRVAVRLETHLEVAFGDDSASLPGLTLNVSEGGLLIQTGAPLKPGVRSRIRIDLPHDFEGSIEGQVEVVRHRRRPEQSGSAIAVRFVDLAEGESYRWQRFLSTLATRLR